MTLDPLQTSARLNALAAHELILPELEKEFQELVEVGKSLFDVPICAITLLGEHTQCFKAQVGLAVQSTPIEVAFCAHTILSDEPMVVLDARFDHRFASNPLVTGDLGIRFYAGVPITTEAGIRLGAFCVIDNEPRTEFSANDRKLLGGLARLASTHIQLRPGRRPAKAMGSFAEAINLGIVTADLLGKVTSWNSAATAIFGHDRDSVIGRDLSVIIPERFKEAHQQGFNRVSRGGKSALLGKSVEVTAVHANGHEFPIELSIACWETDGSLAFGALIQDITPRRRRENELQDLARTDPLTGLMNAKAFRDCIDLHLRDSGAATVLTLDLDGFKSINDSLGHAFGDALLQTLTLRLGKLAGDTWCAARLGGDEFALLLRAETHLFQIREFAVSILHEFSKPILIDGYRLHVGASIGVAIAPDHADDADELLVRADLAMFRSKKEGGRTFRLFDQTMANELTARRAFRDELKRASGERQWELYYQPQYRLADGQLTGVEALLRWRHPSWGIIMPSTFMPVLETHVMAYQVGNWVLEEACRQLAAWRALGIEVPRISVNLFSAQLYTGSITQRVRAALAAHGLEPSDLELEITETIALRHDDDSLIPLFNLIEEGVGIAFDDFGTGFASLTTLQRFPLTRLKIDRSFVMGICDNPESIAVAGGILAIGKALGVDVIAEGIETESQQQRLLELGCLEGQGFLYGKATSAYDFELARGNTARILGTAKH
ncbi:MAG: EAL domain-containing protein [Sphingomicrobium sp.]